MHIDGMEWLIAALRFCSYPEDVKALKHFVFHARLNGASNTCLICQHGAGIEDEYWSEGHAPDCEYARTVERLRNAPTLRAWADRQ